MSKPYFNQYILPDRSVLEKIKYPLFGVLTLKLKPLQPISSLNPCTGSTNDMFYIPKVILGVGPESAARARSSASCMI